MNTTADRNRQPGTTSGVVLRRAACYDLIAWLRTLGRERGFRENLVRLARLEPGESVLDVGCGTGTLAIAAKRRVGPSGVVYGIDPSPEMIARAARKARKAGLEAVFQVGFAQALPFPDAHFDAVLSTLMLHHLPGEAHRELAREMRRVLKPGGRALVVDFAAPAWEGVRYLARFHRHGFVNLRDIIAVLSEADFNTVESGAAGVGDLRFVLAAPGGGPLSAGDPVHRIEPVPAVEAHHRPLKRGGMLAVVALVLLAAGHGAILYFVSSHTAFSSAVVLGVIGLVVLKHLGLLAALIGPVYALFGRRPRHSTPGDANHASGHAPRSSAPEQEPGASVTGSHRDV